MATRRPTFIPGAPLAAGCAALAGCAGPLSTLDPASPPAALVADFWWAMLAGALLILALVTALALLTFTRARRWIALSSGFWLFGAGVAFPVVTLLVLLVYVFVLGERVLVRADSPEALRVEAVGRQWFWTFRYAEAPNPDMRTSLGVLRIPAGRPVDVHVSSADVIHSFWAPRLAGKIDAIPGHVNVIRLLAPEPGVFRGQCSEFCGVGHAEMGFAVEALSEAEFATLWGDDGGGR